MNDDRTSAPTGTATLTPGQRVRARREELEWSQEALAFKAGVSLSTVRVLEKDARPSYRALTLRRISSALWGSPRELENAAA